MGFTIEQQRFIDRYPNLIKKRKGQPPNVKDIVLGLFHVYLTANNDVDKSESAYLIALLKPEIKKKIKLWHLLEKNEFERLLKIKLKKEREATLNAQRRRHEKREDFSLTDEEWAEATKYFEYKCAYCQRDEALTYDHFIPFTKDGSFTQDNIIPCCGKCNSSKNNNDFGDWYKKQTFYNSGQEQKITRYIESIKSVVMT